MERKRLEKRREREQEFRKTARQRKRAVRNLRVLGGEPDAVDGDVPYFLDRRELSVEAKRYHVERILVRVEPVRNFLDGKLRPADIRHVGERKYQNTPHGIILS